MHFAYDIVSAFSCQNKSLIRYDNPLAREAQGSNRVSTPLGAWCSKIGGHLLIKKFKLHLEGVLEFCYHEATRNKVFFLSRHGAGRFTHCNVANYQFSYCDNHYDIGLHTTTRWFVFSLVYTVLCNAKWFSFRKSAQICPVCLLLKPTKVKENPTFSVDDCAIMTIYTNCRPQSSVDPQLWSCVLGLRYEDILHWFWRRIKVGWNYNRQICYNLYIF